VNDEQIPEDLIFDEAIKSENVEKKKNELEELNKQQELLRKKQKGLKTEDEILKNESSIKIIDELKMEVKKSIKKQNEEANSNN
jgi:hypothetical protein